MLDDESQRWVGRLGAAERDDAVAELYALLLRIARTEAHRRTTNVTGPELDDVAHQAAADATLAVLAKLDSFRGESRFTTWAYRFVILEVSAKLGRHYWRRTPPTVEEEDWSLLADRFGTGPHDQAEVTELAEAVRAAVTETLTPLQRRYFVAVVLQQIPLDALVAREETTRGAVYKAIFDARRKIRAFLVANGYLEVVGHEHVGRAGGVPGERSQ